MIKKQQQHQKKKKFNLIGERFEPISHFTSRWNMIVPVSVVMNNTVVDGD